MYEQPELKKSQFETDIRKKNQRKIFSAQIHGFMDELVRAVELNFIAMINNCYQKIDSKQSSALLIIILGIIHVIIQ